MKCDSREMLPIFIAEADQLSLLSRSKTVRVPSLCGRAIAITVPLLEYILWKPLDAHNAYCLGVN